MKKLYCKKCGRISEEWIFWITDYALCLAAITDDNELEYLEPVQTSTKGYAEIDFRSIQCPDCGAWGWENFEELK